MFPINLLKQLRHIYNWNIVAWDVKQPISHSLSLIKITDQSFKQITSEITQIRPTFFHSKANFFMVRSLFLPYSE